MLATYIIFCFCFSVIPAVIASGKGYSEFLWYGIGLIISPIIAGLIASMLPFKPGYAT